MCGRYANHVGAMHGWTDILSEWPTDAQLGFNLAPTQMIPAFTAVGSAAMRWGLIPDWVGQATTSFSTFNARLATVAEKPAFKHAWQTAQRCLIPALGYYEWRQQHGKKQAYFVRRSDGHPTIFAGLYEPARNQDIPWSCTILTRPAEDVLAELHHSMPVSLLPEHGQTWLSGGISPASLAFIRLVSWSIVPLTRAVNLLIQ
jgi:putative SOS response-associated peptidase YedK